MEKPYGKALWINLKILGNKYDMELRWSEYEKKKKEKKNENGKFFKLLLNPIIVFVSSFSSWFG